METEHHPDATHDQRYEEDCERERGGSAQEIWAPGAPTDDSFGATDGARRRVVRGDDVRLVDELHAPILAVR
jgi:hypothetical protein